MNIQLLTPSFLKQNKSCNNSNVIGSSYSNLNNVSYPNLQPLKKDVVSFSGKILLLRTNEVSYDLTSQVSQEAEKPLRDFLKVLRKGLKHLVESEAHPERPIVAGANGIKGRVKSGRSILEKLEALNSEDGIRITTKNAIKKLGDVVGLRITTRSGTQKDFNEIFKALGDMVKRGELKVLSVENYRLSNNSSYMSNKTLESFEKICNKRGFYPEIKNKSIPNGYTAVHVNIELPDGTYAEIQIMGRDMENVKEIEDFYYKYRCAKDFAPKYKLIQDVFEEEMPNLSDFQKETLQRYILDSYVYAKSLPPRQTKRNMNITKDFLPWPYLLPKRLSYENLHEMKVQCDKVAKHK